MDKHMYPEASRELYRQRQELAPAASAAFKAFGEAVFADGALPGKTKELIALAISVSILVLVTQLVTTSAQSVSAITQVYDRSDSSGEATIAYALSSADSSKSAAHRLRIGTRSACATPWS